VINRLSSLRPTASYFLILLLLVLGGSLTGCGSEPPFNPETTRISDDDAQQLAERTRAGISGTFADGLDVSLWAADTLMADPIALDMDQQGRALITVTNRRYSSEIDLRDHPDWATASLRFTHVDDRIAFLKETLAPDSSAKNSDWLTDYNGDGVHDWRDLTVEKDEIYRLEDLTGNGLANRSQLFYRGFNSLAADVAGAVLHHDGEVFAGVAPDMWRLRDTDGDGVANTKASISHGYKVHITLGGHGMSGLTVGPYGRLYWGIGDQGLNVTDAEGNEWPYPYQGAILRSDPDGSHFEVFAAGLRNTHEFVFDAYGNLIAVDNDGDHAGEFERLVHLIDGSDSGWRTNWQFGKYTDPKNNGYKPWMDENYFRPRPDHEAAHVLPPLAPYHPPAGMAYNPGTALGERWQNHFFVARFTGSPSGSGIDAFTLEPEGASFKLASSERVLQGIQVTGMDVGPDGALYLADWGEGWAPDQTGYIWKMDTSDDDLSALRQETQTLLQASFEDRSVEALIDLLGHADQRVRMKAQFALVDRGQHEAFHTALASDDQMRRIHGIWGTAQLARSDTGRIRSLVQWTDDSDPEIRAQVARALGDVRYAPAADTLMRRLDDDSPRVRLFAAQALGRIGHELAYDALVEMLAANNNEDAHLHHAGTIALARVGKGEKLGTLSDHPSPTVRLAAVVALKRLEHPAVARFLDDENATVVTNAARAINDDAFIEDALPALAQMLDQEPGGSEPLVRRAINASLYSGRPVDAERLVRFAGQPAVDEALRAEALAALSHWSDPSMLDRVTGRYRGPVENEREPAQRALATATPTLLRDPSATVREAAVEAIRGTRYRGATEALARLVEDDPAPPVRTAALTALRDLEYAALDEAFDDALNDEAPSVRRAALEMVPDLTLPKTDIAALLGSVLDGGSIEEQQTALQTLGAIDSPAATNLLAEQMDRLIAGSFPRALELELLDAVESSEAEALTARLERYRSTLSPADSVAGYHRAVLYGGDARRGETLYQQHPGGQCTRCHAGGGDGAEVGPRLSNVGAQLSREQLLEAMVAPDARLAPGYGGVTLTLADGSSVRGLVEAETDSSITLRSGPDHVQTLPKSKVTDRVQLSPMPPMGNVLSRSQLRDLVAYLATLKDAS
jgi:putative membrane-bound dehydrogenase-like protein